MSVKNERLDFLIVGQGIAGVILAWELTNRSYNVRLVHDFDKNTSSHLAAGIINPVTGRRYVKTWRYEELQEQFLKTYANIEKDFELKFLHKSTIVRLLNTVKEENDFSLRLDDPEYKEYLRFPTDSEHLPKDLKNPFSFGFTQNAFRLDMPLLINRMLNYYSDKSIIISESFDFNELKVNFGEIQYKSWTSTNIIFSEGIKILSNPYFNYLPFEPSKGQVLIMRIPGLDRNTMFKNKIFITPWKDDLFWVGSYYENYPEEKYPTNEGFEKLISEFLKMWNGEFELIDHIAGIRPTVKDRRPLLGSHPVFPNLFIFNGMGTKGASLVPFMANHFVKYYEGDLDLLTEVSIRRFDSYYINN
jgi:glycine/D-amino acid oxidase-like deaminating enzyme